MPELLDVTDLDLPFPLARRLGRLRGGEQEEREEESEGPKKKKRAVPAASSKAAGSGGKTSEDSSKRRRSEGGSTASQAQAMQKLQDKLDAALEREAALEEKLNQAKQAARDTHARWVPAWQAQTKSLRMAVALLKTSETDQDLLDELKPIAAPYKLKELEPTQRSPSPSPARPAPPPAAAGRKRGGR